jgi:glutathione S-transferase
MIRLYQFHRAFGLPNPGPFCMRVETYLRMAGLPYEPICDTGNMRKAPKGKMPFIDDKGQLISDSGFIIDYLKAMYGDPLDRGFSAEERAKAHAMQRMIGEHLYWAMLYSRWLDQDSWPFYRDVIFKGVAKPIRGIVAAMIQRKLRGQFHGQGMGRHSREEIYALGKADIDALAAYLGDKPYFMGAAPSSLDAMTFAFLSSIVRAPMDSPLKECALSHPQIPAYCERMRAAYFPDFPVT